MANLQLRVGADISSAINALKQFAAEIDKTGRASTQTAAAVSASFEGIQNTLNGLSGGSLQILPETALPSTLVDRVNAFGGGVRALKSDIVGLNITPVIQSITQLEGKMAELRTQIGASLDVSQIQRLAIEYGKVEAQVNKLKAVFRDFSGLKVLPQVTSPSTLVDRVNAFGGGVKGLKSDLNINLNTAPAIQSITQLEAKMAELRTQIGASVDVTEIRKLSIEFAKVETQANKLKAVFRDFSGLKVLSQLQIPGNLTAQVNTFGGGVLRADAALKKLQQTQAASARSTQAGTRAFVDFGRVLQDLPFGPTGIANNLEGVALSLRNVREQSKLTGQSITSILLKSLTGGGGVLFALSAISAVLSIVGSGFGAWTRGFSGASEEAKKLKEDAEELKKTLEELTRPVGEIGAISAAGTEGEIAKVRALATAVQDTNKSYAERKRALEELKDTNKNYFGDLTLEASSLKTLTGIVNEYTQALIAQAVVKGFQDEISKVAVELSKQGNAFKKVAAEANKYKASVSAAKEAQGLTIGFAPGEPVNIVELNDGGVRDATKAMNEQGKVVSTLVDQYSDLQTALEEAVNTSLKFKPLDSDGGGGSGSKKIVKQEFLFEFLPFNANSDKITEENRKQLLDLVKKFEKDFGDTFKNVNFSFAGSEQKAIEMARKFWSDYKKGIFAFKPPPFNVEVELKVVPKVEIPDPANLERLFKDALTDGLDKANKAGDTQGVILEADIDKAQVLENFRRAFDEIGRKLPKTIKVGKVDMPTTSVNGIKVLTDGLNESLAATKKELVAIGGMVNDLLVPAFQSLFKSIIEGRDPLKAFFDTIVQSIEALIQKLIAAAIQALILSALTGGKTSFGAGFKKALGFNKGGVVPGSGNRDSVPAVLTPGEIVVPQRTAKSLPADVVKGLLSGKPFEVNRPVYAKPIVNISPVANKEFTEVKTYFSELANHLRKSIVNNFSNLFKADRFSESNDNSKSEINQLRSELHRSQLALSSLTNNNINSAIQSEVKSLKNVFSKSDLTLSKIQNSNLTNNRNNSQASNQNATQNNQTSNQNHSNVLKSEDNHKVINDYSSFVSKITKAFDHSDNRTIASSIIEAVTNRETNETKSILSNILSQNKVSNLSESKRLINKIATALYKTDNKEFNRQGDTVNKDDNSIRSQIISINNQHYKIIKDLTSILSKSISKERAISISHYLKDFRQLNVPKFATNKMTLATSERTFEKIYGFSKGGKVPGTGNRDTVPALLTPGELIIPKSQVARVEKLLTNSVAIQLPTNSFSPQVTNLSPVTLSPSISSPLATDVISPVERSARMLPKSDSKIDVRVKGVLRGKDQVLQDARTRKSQGGLV
jgi:hypothetical protein